MYDKDEIERKGSILVDFKELIEGGEVINLILDIVIELRDVFEKILVCMGLVIY